MHNKTKAQTQNPHKQWEVHKTMNQQQQNHRLTTDSFLRHLGALMYFTDDKYSPFIMLLLKQNMCLACMDAS